MWWLSSSRLATLNGADVIGENRVRVYGNHFLFLFFVVLALGYLYNT
jgi:hypothetical protein